MMSGKACLSEVSFKFSGGFTSGIRNKWRRSLLGSREWLRKGTALPLIIAASRRSTSYYTEECKYKSRLVRRLFDLGGDEGGRTPDLCNAIAALCQTELRPRISEQLTVNSSRDRIDIIHFQF